ALLLLLPSPKMFRLLLSTSLLVALASASLSSSSEEEDVILQEIDYEAALAAEESAGASLSSASAWLAAARGGRGRRELGAGDTEFRICGKELLTETREICKICPKKDKRSVSSPVFSRFRRASISTKISNMCCINKCRPSEVRAVCC
ncbi:hypothetical protein PMAYCL1PPCAC_08575, partial [Pristionchus mayeri]